MAAAHTALLGVALPCLEASGPAVDAIRGLLVGVDASSSGEAELALEWSAEVPDRLQLADLRSPGSRPLWVEWATPVQRQRSWPASRKGSLGRAVGRRTQSVIDATAGWGQDALRLMTMGYRVQLLERCRVVGALLSDGRRRCLEAEVLPAGVEVPPVIVADACEALAGLSADCIYLDPMFPPKRNASALARRPLQLLRELAGDDDDVATLFEAAWAAARRRVVVKRPDHAKPLRPPQHSFTGTLVRYDVYLRDGPLQK